MAEKSTDTSFFGIQDTMSLSAGNAKLMNDLLSESVSADPDQVIPIETTTKATTKKAEPKKVETKKVEESEVVEEKVNFDVNKFLDGEEEEEPETTTETTTKKVVKKEKEKTEDVVPEPESTEDDNVYSSLSKDLFKLGIFQPDEDEKEEEVEITSPEAFKERFEYEAEKKATERIENFISQFGPGYQEAFDAIFVKGVDPKDYFTTALTIQNFAEMDLTKEQNQIAVVKQHLLNTGMQPEDLDAEVERIKNYGDLEPTAQRYHKGLIKGEAAKLQQLEQEKQQKLVQENNAKKLYYKNVNSVLENKVKAKEFDGIPINPKLAQEVQEFLLADKYKTGTGEKLTDFDVAILDLKRPENHEKKVKLALLIKLMEKDPTFSTIQKAGLTKETTKVFGNLTKHKSTSTEVKEQKAPTSWFAK